MESGEGLASALWRNGRKQAMLALYHPFVVSLATGVLKIESFRHYIAQDIFFLKVFAEAYGIALENTDDEASRSSICQLQQAVFDEVKMHSSYVKASGADITKECKPNLATIRYTEFLLAIATGKGHLKIPTIAAGTAVNKRTLAALTIVSMTPCMRLYAFLGKEISKSLGDKRSGLPYQDWVDKYSSEAFETSTLRVEQLVNNLADGLEEDDVRNLQSVYNMALDLELEFFSAQPDFQLELVPFYKKQVDSDYSYLLVSDFDSTCSIADSCAALVEVSIKTAANKRKEDRKIGSKPWCSSADLRKLWDKLEKSYNDKYLGLLSSTLPSGPVSTFRSYDHEGLNTFLEQLSQFKIQSNSAVVEAGVLEGLDLNEVRKAGAEMLLQEGCADLFRSIELNAELRTHVISVCWSRTFIEAALSKGGINSGRVHSNELMEDGCCTSGNIYCRVETPLDKERIFEELRKDLEKNNEKSVLSVYIGGSVTDLLCLLDADLGIIVGSSTTLKNIAQAFGVTLVPLYQGILDKQMSLSARQNSNCKSAGVLYTVRDWHEIHAFLFGMP